MTEKVTDATPAKVSRDIPAPGQTGTLYGWSSSSSMARSGQLPMAKMVVNELLGGGPDEGTPGEVALGEATPGEVAPGEATPGEAVPGESQSVSIPVGTESIPADAAMMPMIESAILDAHSASGAGMQGGDSGGPFFVDGKLAGLATAGTSNGDPDLPSPANTPSTALRAILLVCPLLRSTWRALSHSSTKAS